MCDNCGCSEEEDFAIIKPGSTGAARTVHHAHGHEHGHEHGHTHTHGGVAHTHHGGEHGHSHTLEIHESVFRMNDRQAERNRGFFEAKGIRVLNLMSSPGSGKTTLLQETLRRMKGRAKASVLVGDLATDLDGQRLSGQEADVLQITTGTTCHLDARMIHAALHQMSLDGVKTLFIENVGNLVCPASFDLGESARVVLFSVTEGEDKPLKYPPLFSRADAVIVTKIDLAAACGFQEAQAMDSLRKVCPAARVIKVSARSGEGMEAWMDFVLNPGSASGHKP